MKKQLPYLKLGDTINVQIIEVIDGETFIVSFSGDLIRVKNSSTKDLRVQTEVKVRVMSLSPLQFQLVRKNKYGLDVMG
jgi:ribosomal protein L19